MNRVKSGVFSWEGEVGINSISLDKPACQILLGLESFKKFVVGGGWVVESDFSVKLETQA